MESWAKQALTWAAVAALMHSATWAGYVHHVQRLHYDDLEQHRGVIEKITSGYTDSSGEQTRYRTLVLAVRPLTTPDAPLQVFSSGAPRDAQGAYFRSHGRGDVVPIWVKRKSGRIDDVIAPATPSFVRLFLILLCSVGLATALIVFVAFGFHTHSKTSPETIL